MSYQPYPYQQQQGSYYPPPPVPQPHHDPFRAYYADRLRQLTFNSRPIIQDLSMMAGAQRDQNNWEGMNVVVQEIEEATLRALPTQKLPLLYLIDSISKNIGPPYTTHLLPPIVPRLYLRTYREVDGVTKAKMEEMINLWRTGGPNRTELYGVGVREQIERDIFGSLGRNPGSSNPNNMNNVNLNAMSRGPVQPTLPTLQQVKNTVQGALDKKQREAASKAWDMATGQQVNALTGILNLLNSTSVSPQELAQIMEQVKTIGLPSVPKQQSQHPIQQFTPQPPPPATPNWGNPQPQPIIPSIPNPSLPLPSFPPSIQGGNNIIQPQPHSYERPPFVPTPQASLNTPVPGSTTPIPLPNVVAPPATSIPSIANLPIDVSKILNSLNKSGIVSQSRTPEPQIQPSTPQVGQKSSLDNYEDMILSMNITLQSIDLNAPNVLSFDHLQQRCKQCGMRFAGADDKFQAHMDWHFRRNRKERESAGRGAHRRWLPRAEEWINDTFASNNEAGPSTFNVPNSPGKNPNNGEATTVSAERLSQLKQKWVKIPQDTKKATSVCPVCKESFVKEWSEDEEEWIWKNALNINNTYYHATCRAEQLSAMRRLKGSDPNKRSTSGSPRLTPQPSELKTEIHPTSPGQIQMKRKAEEEGEGGTKSDEGVESKKVKVEPVDQAGIPAECLTNTEETQVGQGKENADVKEGQMNNSQLEANPSEVNDLQSSENTTLNQDNSSEIKQENMDEVAPDPQFNVESQIVPEAINANEVGQSPGHVIPVSRSDMAGSEASVEHIAKTVEGA